jgi:hypothetical protein
VYFKIGRTVGIYSTYSINQALTRDENAVSWTIMAVSLEVLLSRGWTNPLFLGKSDGGTFVVNTGGHWVSFFREMRGGGHIETKASLHTVRTQQRLYRT